MKDCSWVGKQPDDRCEMGSGQSKAKKHCLESCGECEAGAAPTDAPMDTPTEAPTAKCNEAGDCCDSASTVRADVETRVDAGRPFIGVAAAPRARVIRDAAAPRARVIRDAAAPRARVIRDAAAPRARESPRFAQVVVQERRSEKDLRLGREQHGRPLHRHRERRYERDQRAYTVPGDMWNVPNGRADGDAVGDADGDADGRAHRRADGHPVRGLAPRMGQPHGGNMPTVRNGSIMHARRRVRLGLETWRDGRVFGLGRGRRGRLPSMLRVRRRYDRTDGDAHDGYPHGN